MFVQLAVTHIANIADDGILKVNCRLTKHYPFLIVRKNSVLCVEKKLNIFCGNIIHNKTFVIFETFELVIVNVTKMLLYLFFIYVGVNCIKCSLGARKLYMKLLA